jgi:hypothetical protein
VVEKTSTNTSESSFSCKKKTTTKITDSKLNNKITRYKNKNQEKLNGNRTINARNYSVNVLLISLQVPVIVIKRLQYLEKKDEPLGSDLS